MRVSFGDLNEKIPHGLKCLKNHSAVGGSVRVNLGGVALLEDVCHWELSLKLQKPHVIPVHSLWFSAAVQDVSLSYLLQLPCENSIPMGFHSLELDKPK